MKVSKMDSVLNDIKVIVFMLKSAFEASKSLITVMAFSVVVKTGLSLLWIFIPKFVIDELSGLKRVSVLFGTVSAFVIGMILLESLSKLFDNVMNTKNNIVMQHYKKKLSVKVMEIDYEYLENPSTLDLKEKAASGLNYWGGIYGLSESMITTVSSIFTLFTLLFVVAAFNPWLLILLFMVVLFLTLINNKIRIMVYRFWDKLIIFNRKFRYFTGLLFDYKYGKDIRLYGMEDLLLSKTEKYIEETHNYYIKQGKNEWKYISIKDCINFVQMILIYGFTVFSAFFGKIGIGSLVMYISASKEIVLSTTNITQSLIELKRVCQYASSFYEFCNLPDIKAVGKMTVPDNGKWEIEFINVSFRYPGAKEDIIKDVSIKISSSQKVSVVGLNGAGKTTFIKLLLRLYDPQQGEIRLNGVNIKSLDITEYLKLFSVVFQENELFADGIKENISVCDHADDQAVMNILKMVNLQDYINHLPKGIHTQTLKIFDTEGTEPSGGQLARLALARALYKDAPIFILDEPTANLDPLTEYELYKNFNMLIDNKTTVYISHRLSSCRFCDVIAVFEDGKIVDYGNHQQLLANEDSLYYKMWKTQSQYYVS